MGSSTALVFMHLLADRTLKPGAALLVVGASADVPTFIGHPEFKPLVQSLPCLVDAAATTLAPEQRASLLQAGCRPVEPALVQASDQPTAPVLPANAAWLDGNWYMAAPAKPNPAQSASRLLALKLVQLVNADADSREIEDVFRQDPTLSYHLLRLVNSLAFGASRRITSFSQAIMLLGRQQLKRWLNLMLFAAKGGDHRSAMLLARVSMRARCMELLAREAGQDRDTQDQAFMAGMFSLLGVLFGVGLAELFKPLQLSDALVDGVLQGQGDIGRLLQLLQHAERLDATATATALQSLGVDAGRFNHIGLQACQWSLCMGQEADA